MQKKNLSIFSLLSIEGAVGLGIVLFTGGAAYQSLASDMSESARKIARIEQGQLEMRSQIRNVEKTAVQLSVHIEHIRAVIDKYPRHAVYAAVESKDD